MNSMTLLQYRQIKSSSPAFMSMPSSPYHIGGKLMAGDEKV